MQAYYQAPGGNGAPPTYPYSSASGAAPFPMWAGQPMMPPYGAPPPFYGAMLPPGANPYAGYGMNPGSMPQETSADGARGPHSVGGMDIENKMMHSGGMAAPKMPGAMGLTNDLVARGSSADISGGTGPSGEQDPQNNAQWKDEKEVKKQRRKQSNRESARRSRLRKQAECEELSSKVEVLCTENSALQAELTKLKEQCTSLTESNAALQTRLQELKRKSPTEQGPPTTPVNGS
mmetsp:Transcript_7474/g.45920  ORF Transcript_7474/g.45920 Transcript_7474/m.45920 type:complete len:234 (+) Transcript_7474:382-1083(+)